MNSQPALASRYQQLSEFVENECSKRLRAYSAQPRDATEHFETENEALSGGYAFRQLYELVQNAADAILESGDASGRIEVVLRAGQLATANTGAPLNEDGIVALLNARSSSKRGIQIGRFGIGFKSLLKLGGKVALYSRTAGLRFEPEACRARIRRHLGLAPGARAPGMRLADALDPEGVDSPLRRGQEFDWATTVVVAGIAEQSTHDRLAAEIEAFPAEFLLFLPADIDLVLKVEGGVERHARKRMEGNIAIVDDGATEGRWMLFETQVQVEQAEARADATHVQARDDIPLAWAMPLEGREQAGRFWAFFPTETQTHVPGILNAPWKLNSDRTNLVRGAYNEAVMAHAATLIASALPTLTAGADKGAGVAAFPRKLDRQDDISAPLAKALWDLVLSSALLPDANGELHLPQSLARHPVEDQAVAETWALVASHEAKAGLIHPDCYAHKYRVSRLDSLEAEARKRNIPMLPKLQFGTWLELLASPGLTATRKCLLFMEALDKERRRLGIHAPFDVPIVPTSTGKLCKPSGVAIAIGTHPLAGIEQVDEAIAADPDCRRVLVDILDVKVVSEDSWQDILQQSLDQAYDDDDTKAWDAFWSNVLAAPGADAAEFLQGLGASDLRFKAKSGDYQERDLLVATSDALDTPAGHLLDLDFHEPHRYLLPSGMLSTYATGWVDTNFQGEGFLGYIGKVQPLAYHDIVRRCQGSKPQQGMIVPRSHGSRRTVRMPAAWRLLEFLPPRPAARLTTHLLDEAFASQARLAPIHFEHQSRRETYPTTSAPHPLFWVLTRHGMLQLGEHAFPIRMIEDEWASLLALARVSQFDLLDTFLGERSNVTGLSGQVPWPTRPMPAEDVREFWVAALDALCRMPPPEGLLLEAWEAAAACGVAPKQVPTGTGLGPINEAYVATEASSLHGLEGGGVILLSPAAAAVWEEAGARLVDSKDGSAKAAEVLSPPSTLATLFPELLAFAALEPLAASVEASWVTGLSKDLGPVRTTPCAAWSPDGTLWIDHERYKALKWQGFVPRLLEVLSPKAGEALDLETIATALAGQRKLEARNAVRSCESVEAKLVAAVGGTPAPLLDSLPPATRRAVPEDAAPATVASLAIAVHGPGILGKLASAMDAAGLEPPSRWTGEAAMDFVLDLGFPREFATGTQARRAASVSVNGPVPLPPLHDYQQDIVEELAQLVGSGSGRRRAIVSLPTGGGKTRVAGEAVVRLVLCGEGQRTALWVAQTDELCEQAVQCFEELWANIGTPFESLRIARLWGGQRNPPPPEPGEPVVVIASIQTLASRFSRDGLDWLKGAGIVVIDECHHAITTSYSELFRWLDLQVGNERTRDTEPPVLGLSATPWRGFSDEESERLAARFDRRWIPAAQEELHDRLSRMGVLAARTYTPIRYDREVTLSDLELRHFEKFNELPDSVTSRIGEDEDRNDLIVEAVSTTEAGSILLFANSVAHAQHLAARLHLAGCPAAAVSGETDKLSRQHFTKLFRSGELRVICNHSVLTTGFDAPRADMVFISRPVFSPVLYMQMVGRGLRGPANGGTPHCEIMTVEDNIANFKDQLAFHYCRRFFDAPPTPAC